VSNKEVYYKESKKRSFIKSISWRFVALLNAWVVTYFFIGSLKKSFVISLFANISGFILYYFHERLWNKNRWGRR